MVLFRPWRWWTLNYCAKGTLVVAQQLRRAMKIHNGLPLPCNRGGTGFLANTWNHKWIWREHFPFHSSVCKCTFHGSPRCLNKRVCGGGNSAQQTHHRGSRKGAGEGRIWGLGTSHCSENPCWARGFTQHLQSLNSGSASSPLPAVCQPLKYWDKAGEVLKQPLRWLKRTRKTSSSTSALWVQLLVGSAHFSLIKVHKVQRTEGFDQQ